MKIVSCNLILFPPLIEEDDEVIREAKMAQAAKNIRKRKCTFDMADVEKIGEHEDKRFCIVWFYYSDPIVIEYPFDELDKCFVQERISQLEDEDDEDDDGRWVLFSTAN